MVEEPTMGKMYHYECKACGHCDDVEDVVVDAFFFSQNCKKGKFPSITCPECNGAMECKGS